jgi:hypothetical protein
MYSTPKGSHIIFEGLFALAIYELLMVFIEKRRIIERLKKKYPSRALVVKRTVKAVVGVFSFAVGFIVVKLLIALFAKMGLDGLARFLD